MQAPRRAAAESVSVNVLDIAGFAVNAVLRVDLQLRVGAVVFGDDLIDTGRAIALLGRIVLGQIDRDRHRFVLQGQMRRLVFLVIGIGNKHRGKLVERDFTIRCRIVDLRRIRRLFQGRVIGMMSKGPRRSSPENIGIDRRVQQTGPHAPFEGRADIPDAVQLVPDPARLDGGLIGRRICSLALAGHDIEYGLGRGDRLRMSGGFSGAS